MKKADGEFSFTIHKVITCWHLYSHARGWLNLPVPKSLTQEEQYRAWARENPLYQTLRDWAWPFIKGTDPQRPVKLTIALTKRTDHDLAMAPILRDAVVSLLSGKTYSRSCLEGGRWVEKPGPSLGPTATRELTRLLAKLDDFMDLSVVERVAALA